jgi:topoisomerase-4 subunit A
METTDKLIVFTSDGRFFTLGGDKLPSGRGFGDPIRLMVNMGDAQILHVGKLEPDAEMLVASSDGRGFIVTLKDVEAQTKNGKAVLTLPDKTVAKVGVVLKPTDTHIAAIGDNRKILLIPRKEIPQMAKGRGVTLQKYKDGGLADAIGLNKKDGLQWKNGKKTYQETDLRAWIGERAQAGRMAPNGFPKDNKFHVSD